MTRRSFSAALGGLAWGADSGVKAKITRITLAPMEGRFHRFVAMNAYDRQPKGHTYQSLLIRIQTDQGVEGIGVGGYAASTPAFEEGLRGLIGINPAHLYEWKDGKIVARAPGQASFLRRYRHLDSNFFDLLGKLTAKPAWRLLADRPARERVEVYDGTLYFSDVWFPDRGVQAVVEECEEAAKKGYLGVKLKLGRGWKWMEKHAGLRRDIEVCLAVRKALGPTFRILVDANNGFQNDREGAWRLVEGTAAAKLYWLEELFPENVEHYQELRARMTKAGISTRIADGESVDDEKDFLPYLSPRPLIDVMQIDIRRAGFVDNASVGRLAEKNKIVSIPHNWASTVGGLMGLQLSKAIVGVPAAEDDRSTCAVLQVDGYSFSRGTYSVPDKPGLSISVDEKAYALQSKPQEVTIG